MKKKTIRVLLTAALISSATSAYARDNDNTLSAARLSTVQAPGLQAPGKILIDVWGIPHIYAENEHDLFFLQGFNGARPALADRSMAQAWPRPAREGFRSGLYRAG